MVSMMAKEPFTGDLDSDVEEDEAEGKNYANTAEERW